jgi:hypothetical protein
MPQDKTWGDARYFASLSIFAIVVLAIAAGEVARAKSLSRDVRRILLLAIVCLAGLDAASATFNDINPKTTAVESEFVAFRAAFGLGLPPGAAAAWQRPSVVTWHRFDSYIDPYLAKGQVIMVDTDTAFAAPLFSTRPRQWMINSDIDFQRLADNFSGQFQWLLSLPSAVAITATLEIGQALSSTDGGHWVKAKYFGPSVGELYHWVPERGE